MSANDDDGNVHARAQILSFPTEQRRVSVATERAVKEGMVFTPEDLRSMIDMDDLIEVDFGKLNITVETDHTNFTASWEEFLEKVDITKEPDQTIFSQPKDPYRESLEIITQMLVIVHKLNDQAQAGVLDELNYQLTDIISWLDRKQD